MAGDPPRAWHAKLTAMAMLFSHAEATERMVALLATADGGQKIDPEAARRACRLWLEALGVTRSRKSVHASSQLRFLPCPRYSSRLFDIWRDYHRHANSQLAF